MNEPWKITLLGGLSAQQPDQTITRFRNRKVAALLAYLAFHLRQAHPREVLIEMLWPETQIDAGRNSLSSALSWLRHQLEPPGTPAGSVLRADRFSVGLNPAMVTTDVPEFERALEAEAKAASAAERVEHLTRAVERYPGRLLPGYYEEWITPERERGAAPPSGQPGRPATMTFLLTDIAGPHLLWEQAGAVFPAVLERHHQLLRAKFPRHGGQTTVKEARDSFLVAFPSAGDALACAVACQRALAGQEWPEAMGKLPVRMAVHTGDVEYNTGEYHGQALHRACLRAC
jgi:class 3 adenylate cyclase